MTDYKPQPITAPVPPELEPLVRRLAEVMWDDSQARHGSYCPFPGAVADGQFWMDEASGAVAALLQAGLEIHDPAPHGLGCTHPDTGPAQLCLRCGAHRQDGPHEWRHSGGVTLPLFTVPVMQAGRVVGFISAEAASASIHDGTALGISIQDYVQPSQVVDGTAGAQSSISGEVWGDDGVDARNSYSPPHIPPPDWTGCPCETCEDWKHEWENAVACRLHHRTDGICPLLSDWMEKRGKQ